jgi:RES domain-containing protein
MESLANAIAGQNPTQVAGTWHRHLPAKYVASAMQGRLAYSRWGRNNSFPVLYLGQPTDSVIVEAYRHLVDPIVDRAADFTDTLTPRMLVTAEVLVTNILDMRTATARMELGLSLEQMQSDTNDRDAYAACQEVAGAAHQQGFHGLIAPAATKQGDTLVLFTNRLPDSEVPVVATQELWIPFPDDPRSASSPRLRVVRDD